MSEFYYGLPLEIWDNLINKAEDLLREEDLGVHLVGIYPIGLRVYGIESCSPEILCLYIDSVESLLDPLYERPRTESFTVGDDLSKVVLTDIREWAKYFIDDANEGRGFLNIIPFMTTDVFHQDSSIEHILEIAREIYLPRAPFSAYLIHNQENYGFAERTIFLLHLLKKYAPCLNKNWADVISFEDINKSGKWKMSDKIIKEDNKIIQAVTDGREIRVSNYYKRFLADRLYEICEEHDRKAPDFDDKLLRQAMINFYRFQL